jgi:hypothetical protein
MAVHRIPIDKLSPEALDGVITEFITRSGTDYGAVEASWEAKCRQARRNLEAGLAVLLFDEETETINIFSANDPVLRRLGHQADVE